MTHNALELLYSKISHSSYLMGICNVFIMLLPISIISALLLFASTFIAWLGHHELSNHVSLASAILQGFIVLIGFGIYYPFFRKMNKFNTNRASFPSIMTERFLANQDIANFRSPVSVLPQLANKITSQKVIKQLQKTGNFILYYQPQYDCSTGKVASLEVLIRHQSYDGRVSAPYFIEDFSNLGLISELDLWVINKALNETSVFAQNPNFQLSINVSPETLLITNFTAIIKSMIDTCSLTYSQVELEITEDLLIRDEVKTFNVLASLRKLGIHIALDDFGSGYSSIGYLSKYEFDKVKIDRSLVMNLSSEKGRKLFQLTSELAQISNANIVAEGVEEKEELTFINQLGLNLIQGYYFYKPMPLELIIEEKLFHTVSKYAKAS